MFVSLPIAREHDLQLKLALFKKTISAYGAV